jgi:hypothetical protein
MTTEESNSNLASVSQEVKEVLAKLKTAIEVADKAERIAAIETGTELGAISESITEEIERLIIEANDLFAHFGKTFTPTDRTRLVSTGIRNFGFVETAYNSAATNPQLIPPYLDLSKFKDVINDFKRKQSISLLVQQFGKNVSDGMLGASDTAYHDALEYYNYVKEADRRRIPGAETEYNLLKKYFTNKHKHEPNPEGEQM